MLVSIIVAASDNGVIGNAGMLPWRLSTDLKRFRQLTMGKPVVMGRKTFQSLPKPLDGRDNIVITRDASFHHNGIETAPSLDAGLALAVRHAERRGCEEIMVIGGGEIYAAALAVADRLYFTKVHTTIDGDTTFPSISPAEWRLVRREPLPRGPKDDYDATLEIYQREQENSGT